MKIQQKEIDIYIVGDKQFLNESEANKYNKQTGGKYFRTKISWILYFNKGVDDYVKEANK